jgi:hypothetical protein
LPQLKWFADYHVAMDEAEAASKMTLVWFYDPQALTKNEPFEREALEQHVVDLLSERCVCVKLSTDALIASGEKDELLMSHGAFAELEGLPGLALIDMTDSESPHFRKVVSIFPLHLRMITADDLVTMLELPRGSLTQRTLIFAVRMHSERPASTAGHLSSVLLREAESHAQHQANIALQGHHNWETRFHAINAQLPFSLAAREVCAESWPGQNLFDAAEECVASWRQSPGHWEAVSGRHGMYGYDMKRGPNGVWYATGIFAGRP